MKNLFLLPALIAALGIILAGRVSAQTFTTLYSFTAIDPNTYNYINSDGASPEAGLILSGNTLYGTAYSGGSSGLGTVFAVNTDGTDFTTLHSFTDEPGHVPTDGDGSRPWAGLVLSGNTLYGTAGLGGFCGGGTLFAVNTDGSDFTILHCFAYSDGAMLESGWIILSGNTLYGTAREGGTFGYGTVFGVNTNGTGFRTLHSFTARDPITNTNSDGGAPKRLLLSGNTLYGTATGGGTNGSGTVFKLNTDGSGFTNLYSFTALPGWASGTNSDGAWPLAGLTLSGNTLYGTTVFGGSFGNGTVFSVNTDGNGFTTLHSFTASVGFNLDAGLILSGNTLYGTASEGGSFGRGMVFAVKTDGTSFTTLYSFTALDSISYTNSDGGDPNRLLLSGNTLYGTARYGGSSGSGTVFSLTLPPQLTLIRSAANVILTWPTNAAGFILQSTTNLGSSAVWSTNSPGPVVIGGQNVVTNPVTGPQQFYRLKQ